MIREYGIETIPTGYMLVESGTLTSVEFMSDTRPIPRDKIDIAMAHALAAEYLGMRLIYLETGSGACASVPDEMVSAVADCVSVPVVVGGGIRDPRVARAKGRSRCGLRGHGQRRRRRPTAPVCPEPSSTRKRTIRSKQ